MKAMVPLALCALLLAGCGKDAKTTAQMNDLQAKIDTLNQRVKTVEDDLLATKKELIQEQQARQQLSDKMRDMDNYFNKLQYAQTTTAH